MLTAIPWIRETDARQECFMAHDSIKYTYGSGRGVRTYVSVPYNPVILDIQDQLNKSFNLDYNVCFLNRYDDSSQNLGWHSDDSPGMDHEHPIAVVSFGQPREIWVRKIGDHGVVPIENRFMLNHGSLFEMPKHFQQHWQHRIPKGDRVMWPRCSLTYRHYIPVIV